MAPSSSSLEVEEENPYKPEDALSELFSKLLRVLTNLDIFGRPTSPSIFIVYAHDSNEGTSSGAQCAQHLINWLLELRSRILSDKSPLRCEREGGIAAARNILSNQFCLLPPRASPGKSGQDIASVDKVILCGSEVLQQYYGHEFTNSYIAGIEDCYNKVRDRTMLREQLQDGIREFVETQCQSDGFHHVLTELAFLKLRRKACLPNTDGIIPVALSGDGMSYLPFLANCDLFLKVDSSQSLTRQHKLFFNLLRQLYTNSDSHAVIKAFEDCYKNVNEYLQGEVTITRKPFRHIVYEEILKAQEILVDSRTAVIREERLHQWMSETKSDLSRHDKILDWLPKFHDVTDTHRHNLDQRQGRTGSWILADERYEKWKALVPENSVSNERLDASLLWCYGKPGAGKTIISSVIIEDLQYHMFEPSVAIAYVFCKHREAQTASSLVLSLVAQLAHQHHQLSNKLMEIAERYQSRKAPVTPKLHECMEILKAEMRQFRKVFVVVDALDERLDDGHAHNLLDELLETDANVLITSRDIESIRGCFINKDPVEIEIVARPEDVEAYLNSRFQQSKAHSLQKIVKKEPSLKVFVIKTLVEKTDGIFLLARMHMDLLIDDVKKYPTKRTLKMAIDKLPSELSKVYDEYMRRILESGSAEPAKTVLAWVLFARQPVRMKLMREVISLQHSKQIDDLIDGGDLLNYCIGLVMENSLSTTISLVHPDMDRYFRDPSTSEKIQHWIPDGPQRIVRSCLECLLLDDTTVQTSPLWSYGAKHWGHHVQDKYAELQQLISEYLSKSEKVSSAMQYSMQHSPPVPPRPTELVGIQPDAIYANGLFNFAYNHPVPSKCYGWHVASYFGILKHFDSACKDDIDCRDSNGWTPLWWAVLGRQDAMMKLLLESGAEVNTKSNADEPLAIWMLGVKHDMELVYSLENLTINNRAEELQATRIMPSEFSYIDFIPRVRGFAAQESTLKVIEALSGDGLNARNNNGDTVLMTAAHISLRNDLGETAFLQALKPKREYWQMTNVDVRGEKSTVSFGQNTDLSHETELDPYSFGTLEATVGEMLMTLIPTDMAGNDEEGQEALRLAITSRHSRVVSELLDRGADPNWQYEYYTPLELACMPPNLLIFNICRVSIRDRASLVVAVIVHTKPATHTAKPFAAHESWHAEWSPSHDAEGFGSPLPTEFDSIARMLLNKGAKVNGDTWKSPLAIAAENEYLTIFRTLLDAGADILSVEYETLLSLVEVITQFEFSRGTYDKACFGTLQDFQTHDYCILLLNFALPKGEYSINGLRATGLVTKFSEMINIESPLRLASKVSANLQRQLNPQEEYERRIAKNGNREAEELLNMICSKIEEATQKVREAGPRTRIRFSWRSEEIRQLWSRRRRPNTNLGSGFLLTSDSTREQETSSDPDRSNSGPSVWEWKYKGFLQRWTQATQDLLDAHGNRK